MDQLSALFSNSSTMIPDHARMPVAQAPAGRNDVFMLSNLYFVIEVDTDST
jgi:hypothetical protein